jgi:hypothetical protein
MLPNAIVTARASFCLGITAISRRICAHHARGEAQLALDPPRPPLDPHAEPRIVDSRHRVEQRQSIDEAQWCKLARERDRVLDVALLDRSAEPETRVVGHTTDDRPRPEDRRRGA